MKTNQKGFTIIELLIYVGLTAIILGLFSAILVTVTRVGGEQNNSTEVTSELNFLMTSIKKRIQDSITIDSVNPGVIILTTYSYPTQTTRIRYTTGDRINLRENGTLERLSSLNILIDDLTFTDLSNGNSRSIQISITASNDTNNTATKITRTIQGTAAPLKQAQ